MKIELIHNNGLYSINPVDDDTLRPVDKERKILEAWPNIFPDDIKDRPQEFTNALDYVVSRVMLAGHNLEELRCIGPGTPGAEATLAARIWNYYNAERTTLFGQGNIKLALEKKDGQYRGWLDDNELGKLNRDVEELRTTGTFAELLVDLDKKLEPYIIGMTPFKRDNVQPLISLVLGDGLKPSERSVASLYVGLWNSNMANLFRHLRTDY
ncbi:MAG: hypothetical protein V1725_03340 [archaeon]